MNEKIRELIKQATTEEHGVIQPRQISTVYHFDKEKFAELIVRECAQKINTLDDALVIYSTKDGKAITKEEWLLKQFGIIE
jgi:hypothetical protein